MPKILRSWIILGLHFEQIDRTVNDEGNDTTINNFWKDVVDGEWAVRGWKNGKLCRITDPKLKLYELAIGEARTGFYHEIDAVLPVDLNVEPAWRVGAVERERYKGLEIAPIVRKRPGPGSRLADNHERIVAFLLESPGMKEPDAKELAESGRS